MSITFTDFIIQEMDCSSIDKKWILVVHNKKYVVNTETFEFISKYSGITINKDNLNESELFIFGALDYIGCFSDTAPNIKSLDHSRLIFKKVLFKKDSLKHLKIFKILFSKAVLVLLIPLILGSILFALFSGSNYQNSNFIYILLLLIPCTIFHEIGHITASIKYGIVPKGAGIGIYFTSPVAFVDVDDTWHLSRKQRVVVDISGIYFQLIIAFLYSVIYYFFNIQIFLQVSYIIIISAIFNLNPFLKYDGYWILSDFLGIYNLNQRINSSIEFLILNLIGKGCTVQRDFSKKKTYIIAIYALISTCFYFYFSFILAYQSIIGLRSLIHHFKFQSLFTYSLFLFFAIISLISLFKMIKAIIFGLIPKIKER